jgi:Cytochrome c oxidase subunit IV
VTDESSALLRIAAFGFVVSFIYGFWSKEFLGTWGFIALSLGPGFAGLLIYFEARKLDPNEARKLNPRAARFDAFLRFAGLPRPDKVTEERLEADDLAVIPNPSIWPFMLSIGAAVMATGLIFGTWLVVLGAVVVVWGIWGWVTAANRETEAARRTRELAHRPAGAVRAPRPHH